MKNVLIIDDSYEMRKIIIKIIEEVDGLKVVDAAEDIEDSILSIKKYKPDIIILDYQLKTGTGIDILTYIRNNKLAIKVIFFSQYNNNVYKSFAMYNGADEYLVKSINIENFIDVVKRYI